MSRAFTKEDEPERDNAVADVQFREAKVDWLHIQEKKLDKLLNDPNSKKIKPEILERWIRDTKADIEKTKKELGYDK